MVGAVVVSRDGVVVGHGWHERAGEPHAEVNALDEAGERARGGDALRHARTVLSRRTHGPVHASASSTPASRRVVAAMQDPDPRVQRARLRRTARPRASTSSAASSEAEAARLNQAFITVQTLAVRW